jgi:ABC-type amino acid transport system permease subunit
MRLMRVIADPTLHPRRQVAVEVTLRALLVAAVAGLILGILPAVAEAVA